MLRNTFATLVVALAIPASALAAETVTIATGKPQGGYDTYAQTMAARLRQRNVEVTVTNNPGSDAISLAICNGQADLGIAQADAIYARALTGCNVDPIGVYGSEFAMILFPPKSSNDELADLDEGSTILVDSIGSGSELFARTIVGIETGDDGDGDDWAKATIKSEPVKKANTLAALGKIDAVILVRKWKNDDVSSLLALGWTFGELWDRDIDDLEFNGKNLYAPIKNADGAWGYEVNSFVIASETMASTKPLAYEKAQEVIQ